MSKEVDYKGKRCLNCGILYNPKYGKPEKAELTYKGQKALGLPKSTKSIILLTCPKCFATNAKDDKITLKHYATRSPPGIYYLRFNTKI